MTAAKTGILPRFWIAGLFWLALGSGINMKAISGIEPAASNRPLSRGIASKYPNDIGITGESEVILVDDFESWKNNGTQPPKHTWSVRMNMTSLTHTIPGKVVTDEWMGPGDNVLEIACWTKGSGSQVGGLSLKLGNYNHANEGLGDGYEELYVRYYLKFDQDYRAVRNHGSNLGGRDVSMKDAAWVGMAGIRDVSTRGYFYSGVQPRGKQGDREFEMGFYSYHLDKKGPWGENYLVQERIPIQVGTWHCIERHMKLNSVDTKKNDGNYDGLEELWVDGELTIRKEDVRFRRVPHLRITFFSLETYYHGLPKEYHANNPIRVYFDNVVIAHEYIGPMNRQTANPSSDSGRSTKQNRHIAVSSTGRSKVKGANQ